MCGKISVLVLFLLPCLSCQNSQLNFTLIDSNTSKDVSSQWRSLLLGKCDKPTLDCLERSFYNHLGEFLEKSGDVNLGGLLRFNRNSNGFQESNSVIDYARHNESERRSKDGDEDFKDQALHFLMNHDVEMQLPDLLFEGAVFKISPRSFEDNGIMAKMELIPAQKNGEGRLFFKKIKDFLGEKLMMALLAILLVIKLLSVKFLFLLPMVMGVAAAKKLILKLLLFVFPALSYIFKLCPYVPHGTKYHHHHHHISHIHKVPHGHHHDHHDGIEVIAPHADGPPSLHHYKDHDHHHEDEPLYKPHEQEFGYYSDGPSYVQEFITHRKADERYRPQREDAVGQGFTKDRTRKPSKRPLTPSEIEAMVMKAEKEAVIKARLQKEQIKIQAENLRLQEEIRKALKLQEKLKLQTMLMNEHLKPPPPPPPTPPTSSPIQRNPIYSHYPLPVAVTPPPTQTTTTKAVKYVPQQHTNYIFLNTSYDPFYSPILKKIDDILGGLGYQEEPCKERLICSMYKNPLKFSPHSNLLSAELSRDSSELVKPETTNAAVIRFYKYVQAARDGQDQRDCVRLYPTCIINTDVL